MMSAMGTIIAVAGIGTRRFRAAAIAPISAPALIVLAMVKPATTGYSNALEQCRRSTRANPIPVTMPTLAQTNWIAVIMGKVANAVQSVEKPSEAPATAYVPIPDGSSSEAPVIRPGPRIFRKRFRGFRSPATVASREPGGTAGSMWGIRGLGDCSAVFLRLFADPAIVKPSGGQGKRV
jgi:hypothetical protein